ncbi:MAG TPA: hypothetical protein DCW97_00235, partial [Acidobacteria bacterium]|nr:hypothetical protein [Acidobacteriota bacterium]
MAKTLKNKNQSDGQQKFLIALVGLVSLILVVSVAGVFRPSHGLPAQPSDPSASALAEQTRPRQDQPWPPSPQADQQSLPSQQPPPQPKSPELPPWQWQSQPQSPSLQQHTLQQLESEPSNQSEPCSSLQPVQAQSRKPQSVQPLQSSSESILPRETDAEKTARLKWWADARFGLFIHFGLYALPARHEWVKNHERLTNEQYQKYFDHFNPDLFNPREWARMAKAAGMKYAVITSKHHEGFCLWDSKYTDYKVTSTPFGRDLLKEFVEAFRAEGLKVGFYYSLLDWHHPDYTIDRVHPLRPANEADYDRLNAGKDMNRYRQYMKDQVRELLTNYGEISIMWFDFSFPGKHGKGRDDWDSVGLLKLARSLQPNIIVDDRLDLQDVEGGWDFTTPEQVVVTKWPEYKGKKIPWETCQTFSGSWGYYRDEYTWKSPSQLIELLINSVSKGGNLLLNVGPTGRGTFDQRARERLKAMGDWMAVNSRSIYGCTEAPPEFVAPPNTLLTWNPETRRLYVHLLSYPLNGLWLKGLAGKVEYVQFLHDASEIGLQPGKGEEASDLWLSLPVAKPPVEIPV